jgi:hypothetical protein
VLIQALRVLKLKYDIMTPEEKAEWKQAIKDLPNYGGSIEGV